MVLGPCRAGVTRWGAGGSGPSRACLMSWKAQNLQERIHVSFSGPPHGRRHRGCVHLSGVALPAAGALPAGLLAPLCSVPVAGPALAVSHSPLCAFLPRWRRGRAVDSLFSVVLQEVSGVFRLQKSASGWPGKDCGSRAHGPGLRGRPQAPTGAARRAPGRVCRMQNRGLTCSRCTTVAGFSGGPWTPKPYGKPTEGGRLAHGDPEGLGTRCWSLMPVAPG